MIKQHLIRMSRRLLGDRRYADLHRRKDLMSVLIRTRKLRRPVIPVAHPLPGKLIISLTSYPPRFGSLRRTLESLLNQTVQADGVILWLAHDDVEALPEEIRELEQRGLSIRGVDDVRSYKKLVFALEAFPDAYIVTADDDVFYKPDWLEALVADSRPGIITCHRAHRVPPATDGTLPRYKTWERDVQDTAARRPSRDILPTGLGGILYPPGALHPDVTDSAQFMALCPRADDLWFYWMARRMGSLYQKVGPRFEQLVWPGTQHVALYSGNQTGNDEPLAKMLHLFGNPVLLPEGQAGLRST